MCFGYESYRTQIPTNARNVDRINTLGTTPIAHLHHPDTRPERRNEEFRKNRQARTRDSGNTSITKNRPAARSNNARRPGTPRADTIGQQGKKKDTDGRRSDTADGAEKQEKKKN